MLTMLWHAVVLPPRRFALLRNQINQPNKKRKENRTKHILTIPEKNTTCYHRPQQEESL